MKVLFVCAEVAPFSAVGGLAQVAYFLPKALKEAGVDIRVFTPKYGIISSNLLRVENVLEGLKVPTGEAQKIICNVKVLKSPKKEDPIITNSGLMSIIIRTTISVSVCSAGPLSSLSGREILCLT